MAVDGNSWAAAFTVDAGYEAFVCSALMLFEGQRALSGVLNLACGTSALSAWLDNESPAVLSLEQCAIAVERSRRLRE